MNSLVVYAPASIGNVGVGFDVLGAAVSPINGELLGDRVKIESGQTAFSLTCVGHFARKLPTDVEENIVYHCWQSFSRELDKLGLTVLPVHLTLEKNMPIGSGLGSSACSVVAALVALNAFHDSPLNETQLLTLMGEMEAKISGSLHYDNVAPCYLGGLQLMLEKKGVISQALPHFSNWYWVMAYPGIKVPTAEARAILPDQYDRSTTIAHGRNLGGFIHACYSDQPILAAALMNDVIAEPYRMAILPKFEQARSLALSSGALACGISGSGPTLFAVTDNKLTAEKLKVQLTENYLQSEDGFVHVCRLDPQGTRITGSEL